MSQKSDQLAAKIWQAISVAAFLSDSGRHNEKWLYRVLSEFEESVQQETRDEVPPHKSK